MIISVVPNNYLLNMLLNLPMIGASWTLYTEALKNVNIFE